MRGPENPMGPRFSFHPSTSFPRQTPVLSTSQNHPRRYEKLIFKNNFGLKLGSKGGKSFKCFLILENEVIYSCLVATINAVVPTENWYSLRFNGLRYRVWPIKSAERQIPCIVVDELDEPRRIPFLSWTQCGTKKPRRWRAIFLNSMYTKRL